MIVFSWLKSIQSVDWHTRFPASNHLAYISVVFALVIGVYSQYSALGNPYIFNDDARQHIFWTYTFSDKELFPDDILTEYARAYQPSGYVVLYYLACFVLDPLAFGKFLSIFLFALSALYIYKMLRLFTDNYTSFLGTLLFIVTPSFFHHMVGGFSRSFGFPLVLIFLYYLLRKKDISIVVILLLQTLFYPMVFFICMITYSLSFILHGRVISLQVSGKRAAIYIAGLLICFSVLLVQHVIFRNPSIGTTVTRAQMVGKPEYYKHGRYQILPPEPLLFLLKENMSKGTLFTLSNPAYPRPRFFVNPGFFKNYFFFILLFLLFLWSLLKKTVHFPPEFLYLFLSGLAMFYIADWMLLKFFLPQRYLEYTVPLISLVMFVVVVREITGLIKNQFLQKLVQVFVLVLVMINFQIIKNTGLVSTVHEKELYEFIGTLPKSSLIAAHPNVANNIPLLSKRRVFVNQELSHTWFDRYWALISARTFALFDAYYGDNPSAIYQFCLDNAIDYILVDKSHFTDKFLVKGDIYFEPFNQYVKGLIKQRKTFVLSTIADKDKLFELNNKFIIHRDVLRQ